MEKLLIRAGTDVRIFLTFPIHEREKIGKNIIFFSLDNT